MLKLIKLEVPMFLTPAEARAMAQRLLDYADRAEDQDVPKPFAPEDWWHALSTRSKNVLSNMHDRGALKAWPPDIDEVSAIGAVSFLREPNIGRVTVGEVEATLGVYGRKLRHFA
jgi:hypothetical protein